ncbi:MULTISPECIES: hypothetical protein [unclassified Pseudomonas]|uniref:hypothetical protein n=1 Tax=unclassified Pseudomonas TaxID=196821 RepID=UPI0008EA18FB|nr:MULTISPECIES: hypothetical protein [unclassified Pseudomonas]SFF65505.1 hypothetical protein SAMN03159367_05831 [Pseudomonas sp. NFACC06-1]
MADRKIISVLRGGQKEEAWLDINERRLTILLTLSDGWSKTYTGVNIYDCFGEIIKEHADLKFLCKGAKRNVRPSSMSAQMTLGVVAYENVLGRPASRENLVNIFDYDDQDIISDPQLQKDYFFLWMQSIRDLDE